jgi:hypothetical protein
MTYESLFALLESLGFRTSPATPPEPQVFVHDPTDTVLLFRSATSATVTPADLLSTEVHLQARGISDQPLEVLADAEVPQD